MYKSLSVKLIAVLLLLLTGCVEQVAETYGEEEEEEEPTEYLPLQQFGINVNEQFTPMKFDNVDRSGTTWVRGFLDFFLIFPDEGKLDESVNIQKYLELKDRGYKTILSIKWNFRGYGLSVPARGSDEMNEYKSYLKKLLDKVWSKTDIIVIGNEPYIETPQNQRGSPLLDFYKEIAYTVNDYKGNSNRDIPIFVGAFNNLYLSGWQTESVENFLTFARNTTWIEGIDLHIHHSDPEHLTTAMEYVDSRIRDDQKIMITEFSLMKHWRSKTNETIPSGFAAEYDWDPQTRNYQYIDYALKNQVPRDEWVDFLSSSYWFENRKNYLWNTYERFTAFEKFHIATYALRQSFPFTRNFTADIDPWILNGLFANRTVEQVDGQDQYNYAWIEDFLRIQEDSMDDN